MTRPRTLLHSVLVAALAASALAIAPGATAASSLAAVSTPTACPTVFPVSAAVDGVTGVGYTVERGTTPEPFTARVLGRITGGIAPGVDMIMADLASPALTRAGGVWAGMSGSPVYSTDGRLIGSVSYGLTSASSIAGLTPAGYLKGLINDIDDKRVAADKAPVRITVDRAVADLLAKTGKVTTTVAALGFRQLPTPLVVSGASSPNAKPFLDRLGSALPDSRIITTGNAARGTAPASTIFAGGNFAAALSYGDVTFGAVGTTTLVCAGKAVAFGHPFRNTGISTYSAHAANAVFVQPDPVFGPFKVANFGGVVGTVDRDRVAGVRAMLGDLPATTLVTSTLTRTTGQSRTGTSRVVYPLVVPDVAAFHALYNTESVLGSGSGGSASVTLTVKGLRANGATFSLVRSDKLSSAESLGYAVGDFVYVTLARLVNQQFERVQITSISLGGTINPQVLKYRIGSVKVKQGGVYVTPSESTSLVARAGSPLPVRATLMPYQGIGSPVVVDVAPVVPAGTAGSSGSLGVVGGTYFDPFQSGEATSFPGVLRELRSAPASASVRAVVWLDSPTGAVTQTATAPTDRSVDYWDRYFSLEIR